MDVKTVQALLGSKIQHGLHCLLLRHVPRQPSGKVLHTPFQAALTRAVYATLKSALRPLAAVDEAGPTLLGSLGYTWLGCNPLQHAPQPGVGSIFVTTLTQFGLDNQSTKLP